MARRQPSADHKVTYLSIKVGSYAVRSEASINPNLGSVSPRVSSDEPVFVTETTLYLFGECTHPHNRASERYEVILGSTDLSDQKVTLRDVRARIQEDAPVYHAHRGIGQQVYGNPHGLGLLHRRPDNKDLTFLVWTAPHIVSDWLTLLGSHKDLFVAIEEMKAERRRWVRSISLQTSSPSTN